MPGKVTLDFHQSIAVLTIENNGRLNAIDDNVAAGLAAGVAEVRTRADIGALILRGAGTDAFCSGVDLKYAAAFGDRGKAFAKVGGHLEGFHAGMADLPFPSIAMLHGVCYGGGVHLAIACDFRFAARSLKWAIPAVKNKLHYPLPALERLMRLIGPARTRRLVLEGAPLPPETLVTWGLIDEVHPSDGVETATVAFAERLAAQPRAVVPAYLRILNAIELGDRAAAQRLREEARRAAS